MLPGKIVLRVMNTFMRHFLRLGELQIYNIKKRLSRRGGKQIKFPVQDMTESDTMTYICVGLCVRPCSPMHIYVWAYTYIGQACATVCVKKTLMSFKKIGKFLTNFTTF